MRVDEVEGFQRRWLMVGGTPMGEDLWRKVVAGLWMVEEVMRSGSKVVEEWSVAVVSPRQGGQMRVSPRLEGMVGDLPRRWCGEGLTRRLWRFTLAWRRLGWIQWMDGWMVALTLWMLV